MKLKDALKSSIELCLLALVIDVVAVYVLFNYMTSSTVQIWSLVHTGIPALMQLAVYIVGAIICSYGAFASVRAKLN